MKLKISQKAQRSTQSIVEETADKRDNITACQLTILVSRLICFISISDDRYFIVSLH